MKPFWIAAALGVAAVPSWAQTTIYKHVDENGRVSLQTDLGPAAIDDRDLALFLAEVKDAHGDGVDEATLFALLEGQSTTPLEWRSLPLRFARNSEIPGQLGFQRKPVAMT